MAVAAVAAGELTWKVLFKLELIAALSGVVDEAAEDPAAPAPDAAAAATIVVVVVGFLATFERHNFTLLSAS